MNESTRMNMSPALAKPNSSSHTQVPLDYLRCAVPTEFGGLGGDVSELSELMKSLSETSLSAALLFWSQRMSIEFLIKAENVALREFLLPDLLSFHKAGTVPYNYENNSLNVKDDGRSLYLNGGNYVVTNAEGSDFLLICPFTSANNPGGWCVVNGEEQGVETLPVDINSHTTESKAARLLLHNVFFRGDEILGDEKMLRRVIPVQSALAVIYEKIQSIGDEF